MYILFRKIECPCKSVEQRSSGSPSKPCPSAARGAARLRTHQACLMAPLYRAHLRRVCMDSPMARGGASPGSAGSGAAVPPCPLPRAAVVMSPPYPGAPTQRRFQAPGCHAYGNVDRVWPCRTVQLPVKTRWGGSLLVSGPGWLLFREYWHCFYFEGTGNHGTDPHSPRPPGSSHRDLDAWLISTQHSVLSYEVTFHVLNSVSL